MKTKNKELRLNALNGKPRSFTLLLQQPEKYFSFFSFNVQLLFFFFLIFHGIKNANGRSNINRSRKKRKIIETHQDNQINEFFSFNFILTKLLAFSHISFEILLLFFHRKWMIKRKIYIGEWEIN